MKQIAQGAEAVLKRDGDSLIKERVPKSYRHPTIDHEIRAERTEQEQRLLEKARQAGVNTPSVEQHDEYTLKIGWIEGNRVRDILEHHEPVWTEIGAMIGRLHSNDIIHGDLTTSNMLLTPDNDLYFIDFGLGFFSQRVEDRATDLRLLQQTLEASHNEIWTAVFEAVMQGYTDQYDDSDEVEERLDAMEDRQRYT